MSLGKYRLTGRQHFRTFSIPTDITPVIHRFVKGDVMLLRENELQIHGKKFEKVGDDVQLTRELKPCDDKGNWIAGAVAVADPEEIEGNGTSATITQVSVDEKAREILKGKEPQIREAIRQADKELLTAMGGHERSGDKPRPRILGMIDTRLAQL